jgi:hypothetical protein
MVDPKTTLSRDAEVVAVCCFGAATEMAFARPQVIHPRTRVALDELTAASLLRMEVRPYGAVAWTPTPAMGKLIRHFPMSRQAESFPIFDEALAGQVEARARELYEASRSKVAGRPAWALLKPRDLYDMGIRNHAFGEAAKAMMKEAAEV